MFLQCYYLGITTYYWGTRKQQKSMLLLREEIWIPVRSIESCSEVVFIVYEIRSTACQGLKNSFCAFRLSLDRRNDLIIMKALLIANCCLLLFVNESPRPYRLSRFSWYLYAMCVSPLLLNFCQYTSLIDYPLPTRIFHISWRITTLPNFGNHSTIRYNIV